MENQQLWYRIRLIWWKQVSSANTSLSYGFYWNLFGSREPVCTLLSLMVGILEKRCPWFVSHLYLGFKFLFFEDKCLIKFQVLWGRDSSANHSDTIRTDFMKFYVTCLLRVLNFLLRKLRVYKVELNDFMMMAEQSVFRWNFGLGINWV